MPTTRLGGSTGGRFGLAKIYGHLPIEGQAWTPNADVAHGEHVQLGLEMFAHRSFPDGTPLGQEERRYIAAVALEELRK